MELKKINEYTWEIPKHGDMKVPAIIYASEALLQSVRRDLTLPQAKNVACLRGIQRKAYVMPDAHQGYGFPIGGAVQSQKFMSQKFTDWSNDTEIKKKLRM